MSRFAAFVFAAVAAAAFAPHVRAAEPQPGIVSHVKVLSDKVEDVSSLEAWKKSFIKPGMSNEEKGIAIWKTVVRYRHQTAPPNEFLFNEDNVHDVMKTINVYGYGMCCCASANTEQLARYIGFDARGWAITQHSVPEVQWDNAWHLLDGSLMNYFRNPDGSLASVTDIAAAVKDWHQKNPGYRGNDNKLREFARNENWKKNWTRPARHERNLHQGRPQPRRLARLVLDHAGIRRPPRHIRLRLFAGLPGQRPAPPGERLTRNWFNKGLHVNMDGGGDGPGPR